MTVYSLSDYRHRHRAKREPSYEDVFGKPTARAPFPWHLVCWSHVAFGLLMCIAWLSLCMVLIIGLLR